MTNARIHTEYGGRSIAVAGEILRTVVGSGVHGIAIAGTDDHDENRFLGYLNSQRERLLSHGRRSDVPELVARYGYDVKYALHALWLAYQGLEIARDGRLTLPMPDRVRVLRVNRGKDRELGDIRRGSPMYRRRSRSCWPPVVCGCPPNRTWRPFRSG